MTSAGYISDQRCPGNPEHGKVRIMDTGLYCGHSGHTPPNPELHTKDFWTFAEWESAKSPINQDPAPTDRPRAIKMKKPNARKASRRRSR